jgi:hypothetical protein
VVAIIGGSPSLEDRDVSMRTGPDRPTRYGPYVGLVFVAGGFIAIILGWLGMADDACVDCQMPYIVSAGAGGLALVVFGSTLLVIARMRAERIAADARIRELIKATGRVGTALATTTGSQNGLVVAGKSTYHRPDCRLVQGKDLEKVTVQAAAATGLSACRVCSPETVEESPEGAASGESASPDASSTKKRSGRTRKKTAARKKA